MTSVWGESLNQAGAMLRSWTRSGSAGIPSMQKDTRTLSLNVLAFTGFSKSYDFHGSADRVLESQQSSGLTKRPEDDTDGY